MGDKSPKDSKKNSAQKQVKDAAKLQHKKQGTKAPSTQELAKKKK